MMSNNKQSSVEHFFNKLEEMGELRDCTSLALIQLNIDKNEYLVFKEQAKAMHKEEIENTYAEAYSAGYYRSLELVEWKIKNELKIENK